MSESQSDFLIEIDGTGGVIRAEGKVLAHLGLSAERLRGMRLDQIVARDDRFMALEILESIAAEGGRMRTGLTLQRADGDPVFFDASFRGFRSAGRHLFTRMECLPASPDSYDDPLNLGSAEDLDSVLAEIEADLAADAYDNPTLSVFSLQADENESDPEALASAADRMAKSLAMQASEHGRAVRSGERSVSVLHGEGFEREVAAAKVQEAVGPDITANSFGVDLSDPDLNLHDKLALVDDVLSATDLLGFAPEESGELSAADMRAALDRHSEETIAKESFRRETAFWAEDGAVAFHALLYDTPLAPPGGRSAGQEALCRQRAAGRLQQAADLVAGEHAKVAVTLDAETLMALPAEIVEAARDGVFVHVTDAAAVADRDAAALAARLGAMPGLMLDGVALARSPALQRAVAQAGTLEMIALPRELFGADPQAVLDGFHDTLRLCAGHAVAVHVGDVDDAGAVQSLAGIAGLSLGGAAVWPELLQAG